MADILISKNMHQEASSVSLIEFDKKFTLKLYKDSNFIVSKMQIYSSLYNITYFKYGATASKKYWFDFFHPRIDKARVTELEFIDISRNHF